jgi:hypothetical protein
MGSIKGLIAFLIRMERFRGPGNFSCQRASIASEVRVSSPRAGRRYPLPVRSRPSFAMRCRAIAHPSNSAAMKPRARLARSPRHANSQPVDGEEGGGASSFERLSSGDLGDDVKTIDWTSDTPAVIARSPCDEATQGPRHARRQQPRRSYCGPWVASLRCVPRGRVLPMEEGSIQIDVDESGS